MPVNYRSCFARCRSKVFAAFFAIHAILFTVAQPGGYEIVAHYSNDNGLPQNSINAALQDAYGFIWMTTHGGFVRFDGQNLKVYHQGNNRSMDNNSLGAIEQKNGNIEISPTVYGKNKLQITEGKTVTAIPATALPYYCNTLGKESTDFGGYLPGFLKKIRPDIINQKLKGTNHVILNVVARPNKQNGYAQTAQGDIWYYDGDNGNICLKNMREDAQYFLLGDKFYVYKPGNGLKGWRNGEPLPQGQQQGSLLQLQSLLSSTVDSSGRFISQGASVLLQTGKRLYKIDEKDGVLSVVLLSSENTITNISTFVFLHREGVLLLGTSSSGFYVLKKKQMANLLYKYPTYYTNNYAQNSLYALWPVDDTTLITAIGTITTNNKSQVYNTSYWDLRNFIRHANGTVYLSTNNTIFETNDKFENPLPVPDIPQGALRTFLVDGDTIYFAIDSFLVKAVLKQKLLGILSKQQFQGAIIKSIEKKDIGELYIATTKGLLLLNTSTQTIKHVTIPADVLPVKLYKSRRGDLCMATHDKGWYLYNSNGLKKMPVDFKGYLMTVHTFAEDNNGFVWLPTNNGMFRFLYADLLRFQKDSSSERLFYNHFDKSYGTLSSEYNGNCTPAMATMKNGRFVFPGIRGLITFHPDSIAVEQPDKELLLEDIFVDTTAVTGQNPVLSPGFNTLALHVATPYFGNRYSLRIEYKLSGGTANWTRLQEDGNIRFNRLSPGEYILSIRKLSGFGETKESKIDFRFTVNGYWYQSFGFWILIAGLAALCMIIYTREKAKIAGRQQKLLEERVQQRTQQLKKTLEELGDTVEELETSQSRLKQVTTFREQVTSLVLHDIRSPLLYLNAITENIHASSLNATPGSLSEKLYDLHLGVKEISAHAHQLLMWITIQQDSFNLKKSLVSIYGLLKQTTDTYQALAIRKDIRIYFTADKELRFLTQPDLVEIVLRNLVDNAIKFTTTGSIHLSALAAGNNIRISVADTGAGMTDAFVKQLLGNAGNFIQGNQSGLGYRFIQDVLKKIDGQLAIESKRGIGTTITIILLRRFEG